MENFDHKFVNELLILYLKRCEIMHAQAFFQYRTNRVETNEINELN